MTAEAFPLVNALPLKLTTNFVKPAQQAPKGFIIFPVIVAVLAVMVILPLTMSVLSPQTLPSGVQPKVNTIPLLNEHTAPEQVKLEVSRVREAMLPIT